MILQGQDPTENTVLIEGVRAAFAEQKVDLHIFLTDNKFMNERRCLQTVVHQSYQGFIVDGVQASIVNPNLDCYEELHRRRIPVIFYRFWRKWESMFRRITLRSALPIRAVIPTGKVLPVPLPAVMKWAVSWENA